MPVLALGRPLTVQDYVTCTIIFGAFALLGLIVGRALAAPRFLYLVAPIRERNLTLEFRNVTRKGHCEIEVQSEPRRLAALFRLQAMQEINLFVGFAFCQ